MLWFAASLLLPWLAAYALGAAATARTRGSAAALLLPSAWALGIGMGLASCGYFLGCSSWAPREPVHACDLAFLRPSVCLGLLLRRRRPTVSHEAAILSVAAARCYRFLLVAFVVAVMLGELGGPVGINCETRWAMGRLITWNQRALCFRPRRRPMARSFLGRVRPHGFSAAAAVQHCPLLVLPGQGMPLDALAAGQSLHVCHGRRSGGRACAGCGVAVKACWLDWCCWAWFLSCSEERGSMPTCRSPFSSCTVCCGSLRRLRRGHRAESWFSRGLTASSPAPERGDYCWLIACRQHAPPSWRTHRGRGGLRELATGRRVVPFLALVANPRKAAGRQQ